MKDSGYAFADEDARETTMNKLLAERDRLRGVDPLGRDQKLDRAGVARLKAQLAKHSKNITVK